MRTWSPRVNVTVTEEQHALLLELAELTELSAAGFLRQMLDAATPLLRKTVPALRASSEEMEEQQDAIREIFAHLMEEFRDTGIIDQLDLLDELQDARALPTSRTERSEGGRGKRPRTASNRG